MKMTLYEISAELREELLAEEFNEERLNDLAIAFEQKAGGIVHISNELSGFVDMCKAEEKRIAERRRVAENRIQNMKDYLQRNMEAAEMAELKLGTATAKLQKNPPKVVIDNEERLPAKFTKIIQTTQIDKQALKDALKVGEVPGAHLEQGIRLVFK